MARIASQLGGNYLGWSVVTGSGTRGVQLVSAADPASNDTIIVLAGGTLADVTNRFR